MSTMNDARFERWLDVQLPGLAYAQGGSRPLPALARYEAAYAARGVHFPLLVKVGAALTTKTAIAVAAGALAVGAAGVGESEITGTLNPTDWGKQVVQQVNDCKAALAPGSHGIGQCVSSFAKQHGKAVSADHRAGSGPAHGTHGPAAQSGKGGSAPSQHPDRQTQLPNLHRRKRKAGR